MSNPELKRTNFGDFYSSAALPVLMEIFRGTAMQHAMRRELFFKIVSHDRDIWQLTGIEDMPLFTSVSEGSDYTFSRQQQGYDKTLTVLKYGRGFSISEEAVDDGKFDFVSDALQKLAKSARETQEQAAMDIFNNGFSSETTADGQVVFATAHTTPTGTYTISNRPSTHVDLSFTSLAQAISSFKTCFRGDSGIYSMIAPKYLLVPEGSGLELYAKQLVGSSQQADSNSNNLNPFQNDLQVISSPHLTDADAWFLIADKSDNYLRIIQRKPLEIKAGGPDVGFMNDAMLFKARYREILGCLMPHGVYGTAGA